MYRSDDIVKELAAAAGEFCDKKLQLGNGGNLSMRIPGKDLMVVKGSDVAFSQISRSKLVVADFDGNVVEGEIKPSKESLLHGAIYKKMPGVGAVMHCHSPWATSWAALRRDLPAATYHSVLKLGGPVPAFDSGSYVVPKEFFPEILSCLERNPKLKAFLLTGHGQVAMGKNMAEAKFLAELVEETAQIAILSGLAESVICPGQTG